MPRISREAVTRREALARTLFKEGKTPEEVQAAMMEVDVGGGRKGLKMESSRLAELQKAVGFGDRARNVINQIEKMTEKMLEGERAPKQHLPDTDTDTEVDPNVTRRIQEAETGLAATRARIKEGKAAARVSGLGYYTGTLEEVNANKDTDGPSSSNNWDTAPNVQPLSGTNTSAFLAGVGAPLDDNGPAGTSGCTAEEDAPASVAASDTGIIRAHQCRTGIAYTDLEVPSLTGIFTGTHGGLYCFQMEDGRVFKLYNNDKVREAA